MRINIGASIRLESKTIAELIEEKRQSRLEAERRREIEENLFKDNSSSIQEMNKRDKKVSAATID